MIQYLTLVLKTSTMGWDYDTPALVVYSDTATEIAHLPFVEMLLHEGQASEITPIARGYSEIANHRDHSQPRDHRLAPVAVSDAWLHTMHQDYDQRAKIILIREPVTSNTTPATEDVSVPVAGAAPGVDLPDWSGPLANRELPMAVQDVPVVFDFLNTLPAWPRFFRDVEEWASVIT